MPSTKGVTVGAGEVRLFKDQAMLAMLFLVTLYCIHMLSHSIEKFLLPFVLSMVIIAIVEQPAEWLFLLFSGRLNLRKSCATLLRADAGHLSEDDADPPEEEVPILGLHGRRPKPASATDALARGLSVFITLALIVLLLLLLSFCVFTAGVTIREDWPIYKAGAEQLFSGISNSTNSVMEHLNDMTGGSMGNATDYTDGLLNTTITKGMDSAEGIVITLVQAVTSSVTNGLMFFVQVLLYMFFWLLDPLPVGGRAARLIRSYIKKKFIVCTGYSLSVLVLLVCTRVKLRTFIVCFSFFLSFIPEIGPMVAALLPVPVIVFDSTLPNPGVTLFVVLGGELVLKVLWGNFVEVWLVQSDKEMKIHPVWIICGLMYFGFSFGPLGMLVSVPIIALIKVGAMDPSLGVPANVAEPFIACLEGRRHRKRAERKLVEDPEAEEEGAAKP